MRKILQHIRNNKGDSNVSKMTIVAVVFVVGAILLVLTTSAFRQPINNWFSKVTAGWFADSNGMYEADNQWLFAERNANGTYKGAVYIANDAPIVIDCPEDVRNGTDNGPYGVSVYTNFNDVGCIGWMNPDFNVVISDDGRTITIDDEVFTAYMQGDPNMPNVPNWMLPW